MSTSRVPSSCAFAVAALATIFSYAQPSFADVLPPDGCNAAAGAACDNAGPNNDEPGICVNATCPHETFGPPDGGLDGGAGADATVEEPCVLCQLPDGGSSSGSSKSSSGGCSTSPGSPAGLGLGLILAGAVALGALQRRRRAA